MIRRAAIGTAVTALAAVAVLSCPAVNASAATTFSPAGIDATGATDDTAALQELIDGLPKGATLTFPSGGKYRIEGTLHVKDKSNLTIEGNGALFFATTTGDRTRSQWSFEGGSDIIVRDVNVEGANPNGGTGSAAYVESLEAQHAFNIWSTHGLELDHVSAADVYGDFVYVGPQYNGLAKDIYIRDSSFARNGRQGISVTGADGVRIIGNTITDTRRATFDLEPNGPGWGAFNIDIEDNTIGPGRLNLISAAGVGPEANIVFAHNVVNRPFTVQVGDTNSGRRGPFTIADNTATHGWGGPTGSAALTFKNIDGLAVTGNTIPLQEGRGDYGVKATNSCDVTVTGNSFANAAEDAYVTAAPSCATTTATPNTTPAAGADPTPISEPTRVPAPPPQAPISEPSHAAPLPPTAPVIILRTAPAAGPSLIAAPPQPPSPSQADGDTQADATSQAAASAPAALVQPKAKSSKKPAAVAGGSSNTPKAGVAKATGDSSQTLTGAGASGDSVYLDAAEAPIPSDAAWSAHMGRRVLYAGIGAVLLLLMGLRLRKTSVARQKATAVRTVPRHPGLATTVWHAPGIQPRRHV